MEKKNTRKVSYCCLPQKPWLELKNEHLQNLSQIQPYVCSHIVSKIIPEIQKFFFKGLTPRVSYEKHPR